MLVLEAGVWHNRQRLKEVQKTGPWTIHLLAGVGALPQA
jgi:hypothetical protein